MDPLASSVRELNHDAKGTRFDEQTVRVLSHLNDHHLCDRCGKCCTEQNVGMTGPEIIIAAGSLGLKCSEFKKLYIEKQIGRWHIIKKIDGTCAFLELIRDPPDDEGKELLIGTECLIYKARPKTCMNFPWLSPEIMLRSKYPRVACNDAICPNMSKTFKAMQGEGP